jgi:hypothetical protein
VSGLATYVLDGHEPVLCDDMTQWGLFLRDGPRWVARTELLDGSVVSTVFLGIDHNWSGSGPPVLFESALLIHEDAQTTDREWCHIRRRYCTWAEAEVGHIELCEQIAHALPAWKAKAST